MSGLARKFNKVAVLMGGGSSEREISLLSGEAVAKGLERAGYEVARVVLTEKDEFTLPPGTEGVFIALHGSYGEDGGVQETLERMGVPYTGSRAESSRISFDKVLACAAFSAGNVPIPNGFVAKKGGPVDVSEIGYPLVVKPPRQGSSVGVSIVKNETELAPALDKAFMYGDDALVEDFIPGREWTVPVVGETVLPIVEISPKLDGGWYSWDAKYKSGGTTVYTFPEDDPSNAQTAELVRELAMRAFRSVDAYALGRIDFRISSEDGKPYVLEINSIPGCTENSILPKSAAKAGTPFHELCSKIMESAKCG